MFTLENIEKRYTSGSDTNTILSNVSLSITAGETIAITGPSGSGKSTLLRLLAGLEKPTSGNALFNNQNIYELSDSKRAEMRSQHFGFIFQSFRLFPALNVFENIQLACEISNIENPIESTNQWLNEVGLVAQKNQKPETLSGGEQQRVAIARALATSPSIILADEPTGNLDKKNSDNIKELLSRCTKMHNTTLILVTHDLDLATMCNTRYELSNSQLNRHEIQD